MRISNTAFRGSLFEKDGESVYIFNLNEAEAFIKPYMLDSEAGTGEDGLPVKPLSMSGKRVRAIPQEWMNSFGNQYYLHQHNFPSVESQSEDDWKIRMEGQLFETGEKILVTSFDELKGFITQELTKARWRENQMNEPNNSQPQSVIAGMLQRLHEDAPESDGNFTLTEDKEPQAPAALSTEM
jgi:hypothetical protein